MDRSYEGFYARFDSPSKEVGSLLMGPDNIVGDDYSIEFRSEDDRVVAWVVNKFGADAGFFNAEDSLKIQLAHARGLKIRALLSFIAYSDMPDPGLYWGEMAVICYNPAYESEISSFVDRVAIKISEGVRVNINLGSQAFKRLMEEPEWMPTDTVAFPKKETGMAILKDHRSMSEKMIEQGRNRNVGCYVVSWAFIIVVVLAIAYGAAKIFNLL